MTTDQVINLLRNKILSIEENFNSQTINDCHHMINNIRSSNNFSTRQKEQAELYWLGLMEIIYEPLDSDE